MNLVFGFWLAWPIRNQRRKWDRAAMMINIWYALEGGSKSIKLAQFNQIEDCKLYSVKVQGYKKDYTRKYRYRYMYKYRNKYKYRYKYRYKYIYKYSPSLTKLKTVKGARRQIRGGVGGRRQSCEMSILMHWTNMDQVTIFYCNTFCHAANIFQIHLACFAFCD